ncbi:MAG TPA: FHA domain-containing protein [Albitalea sp.]|uniref:FHA domain-containing protein n=1 Tax=Piscinibacter sp. TaxID=1903157 RepID=UPI002ED61B36
MLSGLHRGAALGIATDEMTIGASPEADILVADPGIAACHARIRREGPSLVLEPAEGKVHDAAGAELGAAVVVVRGSVFRLDQVWIGFFAEEDPWLDALPQAVVPESVDVRREPEPASEPVLPSPLMRLAARLTMRQWAYAACALVALGMLGTFWSLLRGKEDGLIVKRTGTAAAKAIASASAVPEGPSAARISDADLQRIFRQQLADRSILEKLDVDFGANVWSVTGALDDEERARLERMVTAFKTKYAPPTPIKITIVPWSEMLPFRVVQITSGKTASVLLDTGERLFVGDTAREYRLVAVEPGKAVFQGKRRIEVAW